MIETISINKVIANPNNPRVIRDDKFKKLVKSIQEFPEMLSLRPIVVNDDMVVLGGNMRLKACISAGLKEVPIIVASNLTPEKQNEFVIKDNASFGDWNWDELANEWDALDLDKWGLDFPHFEEEAITETTQEDNAIKISIETTSNTYMELEEKLKNLCDEYNVIMKVK